MASDSRNTCALWVRRERSTLDDYVQVFVHHLTVDPAYPLSAQPDTLSLDDFCFTYLYEPGVKVGGVLTARDPCACSRRDLSTFCTG